MKKINIKLMLIVCFILMIIIWLISMLLKKDTEGYVDLGLPSGTLWAKCNLGATNETECGDYYIWGVTGSSTDTISNYGNILFDKSNVEIFDLIVKSKYPNRVLPKEFDAAYQATDGKAHMPTAAQFQELYDNTDNEWVDDFNGSGVDGWKFTSKRNGNSIFLPATGFYRDKKFYYRGSNGYYWSSSLHSSNSDLGFCLAFQKITGKFIDDATFIEPHDIHDIFNSLCIRAVME